MACKILIVGMYDNPGGIEKITFDYVSRIKSGEFEFSFLSTFDKIAYQDELENIGCKVFSLPNPKKQALAFVRKYVNLCKQENFDIIHINMLSAANILPLFCAKLSGCKNIILHSHNSNTVGISRHILHFFNRIFVKFFANIYLACSISAAKFMFDTTKNVKFIRNAIDIKKYAFNLQKRENLRQKLNLHEDALLIGHIGRFEKQKNHPFLIKVFSEIVKIKPNAILLLVGVGYAMNDTKKLVNHLGLTDKVVFYGISDDTTGIYSALDLFLLPSLFEGLPIVGVEAQCSGLPILASNKISKEMQITNLVLWLKLSQNEQVWANKALDIIHNVNQREIYAKEVEKMGFSIEKEVQNLAKLYKEAIK